MANTTKLFVHVFKPEMTKEERIDLVISAFSEYGDITEDNISLITDREHGGYTNYCFVEIDADAAKDVVNNLNETEASNGLNWSISVAKPKTERSDRSSGGYNGGYRQNQNKNW